MRSLGRWTGRFYNRTASRGLVPCTAVVCTAIVTLLAGGRVAYSGPCTGQINALEAQIRATPEGPKSGPTAPQSLGAQLHFQPTPRDVAHAEHVANADADAALARARTADTAGDAAACGAALAEAKRLYDIDQ